MWNNEIIKEACQRFQGDESSIQLIGGTCKHVFEYRRHDETCILKLFPLAARDQKLIRLELDWMSYLRDKELNIPETIPSIHGHDIELLPVLPIPFCAVSFKKGIGEKVDVKKSIFGNNHFFRLYGQLLGKLHFLSRRSPHDYTLLDQWNEGEIYHGDFSLIDDHLLKKWNMHLEQISTFEKTQYSYGLIHNDLHLDNFLFTSKKEFILYDFSNVKYHWYTYDIAVSIFHIINRYQPEDREQFLEHCLLSFMEGYLSESSLDEGWERQIQFFLDFYELFYNIEKTVRHSSIA